MSSSHGRGGIYLASSSTCILFLFPLRFDRGLAAATERIGMGPEVSEWILWLTSSARTPRDVGVLSTVPKGVPIAGWIEAITTF